MKSIQIIALVVVAGAGLGCTERTDAGKKANDSTAAQAQAGATKEMQQLPATFKPRYNQKLDTGAKAGVEPTPAPGAANK